MLLVILAAIVMIVCCYHVTYKFQSESALFAKELLAQSRHYI